ncbi:unnamed protein product [Camellia sinensis]
MRGEKTLESYSSHNLSNSMEVWQIPSTIHMPNYIIFNQIYRIKKCLAREIRKESKRKSDEKVLGDYLKGGRAL